MTRVDWFRVLADLQEQGLTRSAVSLAIGIPKSSLQGYANSDIEPSYRAGTALIALWSERTGKPAGQAPCVERPPLSAAKARA